MPIGLIAAGVTAAATIGGAVISSKSQKKAANTAAAAQTQATDAQLQLGRENINFQQGIYNQNKALLSPFVDRGNVAGNNINALLGLGGQSAPAPAPQGQQTATPAVQQPLSAQQTPLAATSSGGYSNPTYSALDLRDFSNLSGTNQDTTLGNFLNNGPAINAQQGANAYYAQPNVPGAGQNAAAVPQAANSNALSAQDAFNQFAHSAGIDFQLQQGTNALQHSAAARGLLQSGATLKGLQNYGQNTALNNYFLPYMGLLQGQQAVGAQSGAAIAGVGSNFGNTVSSIYGNQQNAIGNGADALSNAALLKGQANSNLGNSIGSALGGLASNIGSSYTPTPQIPGYSYNGVYLPGTY